jgi:hypothetical protein
MVRGIVVLLVTVAAFEALPLALAKAVDLGKLTYPDQAPRLESVKLLPNPFLSTG